MQAHQEGVQLGKGSVIGQGLGGEPVVGEQFGVNLAEGRKKVDGMVGLAKLIAGDGQGESEAEQDGQAGAHEEGIVAE